MITTINISATPEDVCVVVSGTPRKRVLHIICLSHAIFTPIRTQQRRARSSAQHIHNNGSYAQMIVWEIMHNTMLSVDEDVVLWLFPRRTLHEHTESVCLLLIIVIIVHKHNVVVYVFCGAQNNVAHCFVAFAYVTELHFRSALVRVRLLAQSINSESSLREHGWRILVRHVLRAVHV